jgi:rubredoxin
MPSGGVGLRYGHWLIANGNLHKVQNVKSVIKGENMDRYICSLMECGYVYDPHEGDPDNGIAAGTSFDDLPDEWECPICGAKKAAMEKC